MELRLPSPCLIVLVGPSGSGKTTWARATFAENEIVSSDSLRAIVGAGVDDQAASTAAFEVLELIMGERIRRGLTTAIDTTGLDREARRRWVGKAHDAGLPAYAIVFDTPVAVCLERNAAKSRPVPQQAIRGQFRRFTSALEEVEEEGFDGVHTERAVAVVPPRIAASASPSTVETPGGGHTFGLILNRFNWPDGGLASQLAAVAKRAEAAGFRDLWVMDHFRQIPQVGRAWEDIPEAYTTLAFLAGQTETLRLGALVTGISHRHPVILGKMIATLDVLSGGRALCGLGVAWDSKEHASYGIDFPPVSTRYEVLLDTLELLPLLWGKGSPSFQGRVVSAEELICYPRPLQEHIPILIGGSGERRTLRIVAEHADAANVFGPPERVKHKVEVLNRHCEELGRGRGEIEVTHLVSALAAPDRRALRSRVDELRERNTTPEEFSKRHNAGTVDDLIELFGAYHLAGATHSIVSLPDVALDGSIEAFAEVIAKLDEAPEGTR